MSGIHSTVPERSHRFLHPLHGDTVAAVFWHGQRAVLRIGPQQWSLEDPVVQVEHREIGALRLFRITRSGRTELHHCYPAPPPSSRDFFAWVAEVSSALRKQIARSIAS